MGLHNYERAFRDIAREAPDLLTAAERRRALALLDEEWPEALWRGWEEEIALALSLLGLTPAARKKRWASIDKERRPAMALRLMYLALRSANVAEQAQAVQQVSGMGYRKALKSVAEDFLRHPIEPSEDDLRDVLQ